MSGTRNTWEDLISLVNLRAHIICSSRDEALVRSLNTQSEFKRRCAHIEAGSLRDAEVSSFERDRRIMYEIAVIRQAQGLAIITEYYLCNLLVGGTPWQSVR